MSEENRPNDDVIALALGEVRAEDRARLEGGLRAQDAAIVARLRAVLETMAEPGLEAAPASLVRRLVSLDRRARRAEAVERFGAELRRFIASVVFDSRVNPALAGFRGGTEGRQVAYSSEGGGVHLRVSGPDERDDRMALRGAIEWAGGVSDSGGGGWVRLTGRGVDLSIDLDDDGMFATRLEPGAYQIVVALGDVEIDLGVLDVA